jgi:hypothetical protein
MTAHGSDAVETTFEIDGQLINGVGSDGTRQHYMNDSANQEVTYQTSGISAEASRGGVRVNMIGRSGGNTFAGALLTEGMGNEVLGGRMLSDNLTQALRDRGVTGTSNIGKIYDINGYVSGPVVRDRLWFFVGSRRSQVDLVAPSSFYNNPAPGAGLADWMGSSATQGVVPDSGRPAFQEQSQINATGRLTYQISSSNKFMAHYDRMWREQPHIGTGVGTRIEDASAFWRSSLDVAWLGKWTATLGSRGLLEVGISGMSQHLAQPYQTESNFITNALPNEQIFQERPANFVPCFQTPCFTGDPNQGAFGARVDPWYQVVRRQDLTRGTAWGASAQRGGEFPQRMASTGALSYVTGTHQFKVGYQWSSGHFFVPNTRNGDVVLRYRNGVPDSVETANTPINLDNEFNYDIGVYGQDTWKIDRLTLNLGVRYETFKQSTVATESGVGRFAPERNFPAVTLPIWHDVAPRLGFAYDVFGEASTAIKASLGKYVRPFTTGFVQDFNLMGTQGGPRAGLRDVRDWDDCHYRPASSICSGTNPYGTNGDNVAQDWEIGPPNQDFFAARATDTADSNLQRPGNWLLNVGVEREVLQGVRVNVNYYRRHWFDLFLNDNRALTLDDWTAFTVPNPLGGANPSVCCPDAADLGRFNDTITIYNRNPNTRGLEDTLVTYSLDGDTRSSVYNGLEFGWFARFAGGGTVFGAFNMEKTVDVDCDSPDNPNTFRFCDDNDGGGVPFQNLFKLAGTYPLPYGVQVSGVLQSYPGSPLQYTWSPPRDVFADAGLNRTETVSVRLVPIGAVYQPRKNQVDMSLAKWINLPGGLRWKVSMDMYNVFNIDTIEDQSSNTSDSPGPNFGRTLGRGSGVQETWVGRMWKIGSRLEF